MSGTNEQTEQLSPLKRAILEIRELRARLERAERTQAEPIAIIGLGCRLPGGVDDADSYWRLLTDGVDAIGPIPSSRWPIEHYYDADPTRPGHMYTRHGGFLEAVDQFDASFFGIAPREAASMDPQQRLLLEVTWEALERAGQAPDTLRGSQTGVFIGMSNSDYGRMVAAQREAIDVYYATGTNFSVAAGRIAYLLGLHGPALVVDTACSASLVAVHLACQSLRRGESSLALVGGVNLILAPEINITFSQAQMMAPDGRCKTFDAAADGYVRGEGCVVVVLKRLAAAVANGDRILAVIRGSAVNQDGRTSGLTAPNGLAQQAVIRAALADAGVAPRAVDYVEAHGTGTALGDPIEVGALGAVYAASRGAEQPLIIGSVKTNLGHLEAAAGLAGLAKVVLALQHDQIPAQLHCAQPSPHIDWVSLPIRVATTAQPWPAGERRLAGVSSFGFSGTNAHIIVEAAPPAPAPAAALIERPRHLLALSAASPAVLRRSAAQLADWLEGHPDQALGDVALALNTGRSQQPQRLGVVAESTAAAGAALRDWLAGRETPAVIGRANPSLAAPEVAFLFTGHGAQTVAMAQSLYTSSPTFRRRIDECDALLATDLERPLRRLIDPRDADERAEAARRLDTMTDAQPALFAVQYALAGLWGEWGVAPTLVLGHSAGEYAAATIAGCYSLADGLKLIATRGRLLDALPEKGEMVAVRASAARVQPLIEPWAGSLAIAALNGPESIVLSGRRSALQPVIERLTADGIETRRLAIAQASHSPLIEPILDDFERVAATVDYRSPAIGLISSLTGQSVTAAEIGQASYWRRHLREPVQFATAVRTLYDQGIRHFIEIGPHPTLLGLARQSLPEEGADWLPSLRSGTADWAQLLESLATLWSAGWRVDWLGLERDYPRQRLTLPTTPWERRRYWFAGSPAPAPATALDWSTVVTTARRQADQGPLDLAVASYPGRWAALNRLALAYLTRTLSERGLFRRAGERQTLDSVLAVGGFEHGYERLIRRWLDQLVTAGQLQADGAGWFSSPAPLAPPPVAPLEEAAATALADTPFLLDYLRRCGAVLTAVVTGGESALETLFPGGSYATVDGLYHHWSVARYFNDIVRAVTELVARARVGGRPVRLLEIGAGTGGTTAAVLPALVGSDAHYLFTDVSDFFLTRAAERFAAYPFVAYQRFDLEDEPAAQGLAAGQFDLIIAANVLHATRDLDRTLASVRELLAADGQLVLLETTAHPGWFDVSIGLIEGWQAFDDRWRVDNPVLDAARWGEALAAAGFVAVTVAPGDDHPAAVLNQRVIVARGPAVAAAWHPVAAGMEQVVGDAQAGQAVAEAPASEADELRQRLAGALADERREILIDYVRRHLVRVLRLRDGDAIDRQQRLMDFGVDSLMAVELRRRLGAGLELAPPLPATLIFDYPTIGAIADHLDQRLTAAAPVPMAPAIAETAPPLAATASTLAELSDEEVEALLLKRLEAL